MGRLTVATEGGGGGGFCVSNHVRFTLITRTIPRDYGPSGIGTGFKHTEQLVSVSSFSFSFNSQHSWSDAPPRHRHELFVLRFVNRYQFTAQLLVFEPSSLSH